VKAFPVQILQQHEEIPAAKTLRGWISGSGIFVAENKVRCFM
jgi:hypothetical protein